MWMMRTIEVIIIGITMMIKIMREKKNINKKDFNHNRLNTCSEGSLLTFLFTENILHSLPVSLRLLVNFYAGKYATFTFRNR